MHKYFFCDYYYHEYYHYHNHNLYHYYCYYHYYHHYCYCDIPIITVGKEPYGEGITPFSLQKMLNTGGRLQVHLVICASSFIVFSQYFFCRGKIGHCVRKAKVFSIDLFNHFLLLHLCNFDTDRRFGGVLISDNNSLVFNK